VLLSQSVKLNFPDGSSLVVPLIARLPRTGGVSMQRGTILGIGVGQPPGNTVQVTDVGSEDVQAQWNGGPVNSFSGTGTIVVEAQRARNDKVTFNLTAPRTSPMAVAKGSQLPTDATTAREGTHSPEFASRARTSGSAVQNGSVLTVVVNKRTTNTVALVDNGGEAVSVEWNGGAVHSFTGVATVVVETRRATTDVVALRNDVG
jgi:hypothetical protein